MYNFKILLRYNLYDTNRNNYYCTQFIELYNIPMKTSSRIALQFTIWIAILSGVLLLFLNGMFLMSWVRSEAQKLAPRLNLPPNAKLIDITFKTVRKKWGQNISIVSGNTLQAQSNNNSQQEPQNLPFFPAEQERFMALNPANFLPQEYPSLLWIQNIRYFEDRRWIIGRNDKFYIAFDVSQNVDRQEELFYTSLLMWILVSAWSFILGRLFVRRSLRDLTDLIKKLHHRAPDESQDSLIMSHLPQDDEINSIATAIMWLEKRVATHYESLRSFVWHVSHELKTPLMVMRSDIDLADRTKNYEHATHNIRNSITTMQNIIETLLTISRLQSQDTIETTNLSLNEIIHNTCTSLEKKHTDKNIHYSINGDTTHIQWNEHLTHILFSNLLDNAWKYSKENDTITIDITAHACTITNPGTLSEKSLKHMREPFRQDDKNRTDGIGIWLTLAQNIARIHKRQIDYNNQDNTVICTILFDKTTL